MVYVTAYSAKLLLQKITLERTPYVIFKMCLSGGKKREARKKLEPRTYNK